VVVARVDAPGPPFNERSSIRWASVLPHGKIPFMTHLERIVARLCNDQRRVPVR
jgi:hypothetical protein